MHKKKDPRKKNLSRKPQHLTHPEFLKLKEDALIQNLSKSQVVSIDQNITPHVVLQKQSSTNPIPQAAGQCIIRCVPPYFVIRSSGLKYLGKAYQFCGGQHCEVGCSVPNIDHYSLFFLKPNIQIDSTNYQIIGEMRNIHEGARDRRY